MGDQKPPTKNSGERERELGWGMGNGIRGIRCFAYKGLLLSKVELVKNPLYIS